MSVDIEIEQNPETKGPVGLKENNCSTLVNIRAEDMNNAFKEEMDKALAERDDIWRRHEKQQISYLQNQNSQMLSRLHLEIERLHNVNRDLERRLYMGTGPEILDELKNETTQLQSTNEKLKNDLACSENKTRQVAQKLEQNAKAYSDQIADHETRIRQLSAELDQRTLTITQLSTQLRNFKLREAMAQAQQRRRASCIEPIKQISPTTSKPSGFRLFAGSALSASPPVNPTRIRIDVPGKGTVVKPNASVSVSYPIQSRRLPFLNPLQRASSASSADNSIEKPAITRSTSAVGIPPTKLHLLNALRNAQETGEDHV